jgi:anti-sigma factor RsiW
MTICERFLAGYSAFRDDLLPWDERVEFEVHLDECETCARYDRVVRRGTDVLRGLPELEVSGDFAARLQHRIFTEDLEAGRARRSTGAALAPLAAAAAIAAAAWVPLLRPQADAPAAAVAERAAPTAIRWELPHREAGRVTSQLERLGVAVAELPYHDLVFKTDGPLMATLAAYSETDYAEPNFAR